MINPPVVPPVESQLERDEQIEEAKAPTEISIYRTRHKMINIWGEEEYKDQDNFF